MAVRKLLLFVVLVSLALSSGCAINRATATHSPDQDLSSLKSLHVVRYEQDKRDVNMIIFDKLVEMGFEVGYGEPIPEETDALVTYRDKWVWDITMYMLELTIKIRDPETQYPLATGNSFHTSLTRKSAEGMVDEVLRNIFMPEEPE